MTLPIMSDHVIAEVMLSMSVAYPSDYTRNFVFVVLMCNNHNVASKRPTSQKIKERKRQLNHKNLVLETTHAALIMVFHSILPYLSEDLLIKQFIDSFDL